MLRVWVFLFFFDACAGFVHLVVWFFCFFWCLCRFCDSIKKTQKTKAWSSQNLHRHQKNKKNKTFVTYRPPTLSRCSEFCFFCFFWCLCRFCASSGLFFFGFFDACAGFVTLTFTKHAQASKKPNFCQALISSTAVTINFTKIFVIRIL